MNRFTPVWAMAICLTGPDGTPSETKKELNLIVPVVPILAPNTQAIAEGNGNTLAATRPTMAVVDRLELCQRSVQMIPPKKHQYGFFRK